MNSSDEIRYNMQHQVKKYLDNHSEKWSAIPAIVRQKNELDENLQAIKEKLGEGDESTKPITGTKNELKEIAALKAAILAGGVAAFAAETNDPKLGEAASLSKNTLYRLSDSSFRTPIDGLIALAKEKLTELSDQGITKAQIKELETTLDDFSELVGDPRRVQIQESLRKQELSELVKSGMTLLNDRMDKSMLRYKLIDPIFYEGYERSRVIVG